MTAQTQNKQDGNRQAEFGETKSNSPLDLDDNHITLVDSTQGKHKGCGGMVAEVHDEKNWPTEHILICQHCNRVVFQNDVIQGDA